MSLSDKQLQIINQYGKFVVKACPGSGKTFSVAHRLYKNINEWEKPYQGIATLSFTNVAWQVIERQLSEISDLCTAIRHPHFIGTIDSFLNQYIVMPFGKLSIGCEANPQLIGPPVNEWEPSDTYPLGNSLCNKRECKINQISIGADESVYNLKYKDCPNNYRQCRRIKSMLFNKGYLSQSDANYFSLKVLREYPRIAKYITSRFPMVMIDEAQDTSDVQMAIIDILIENGLSEIMLIGDPDQAIFEWRRARPDLFIDKYQEWRDNSLVLDENFRSSQAICDFTDKLSCPENKTISKNQGATQLNIIPEIIGYSDSQCEMLTSHLLTQCEQLNISLQDNEIVVLARSNDFISVLKGISSQDNLYPWNDTFTREICQSKYIFEANMCAEALILLGKAICKKINNLSHCTQDDLKNIIQAHGFTNWRKTLFKILQLLPSVENKLGDWIQMAKRSYGDIDLISDIILKIKRGKKYEEMAVKNAFSYLQLENIDMPFRSGTVHSVKGKSCDAALVVLKRKGLKSKFYKNMLAEKLIENEEMRIVYVALTRARKLVILAVPSQDKEAWRRKFDG